MGMEFMRQVLDKSQKVWLAHVMAHAGLIKAQAGDRGVMV